MNDPDGAVLRLLDANGNRAREGLRVLEDYARFVLNSDLLSGELKGLRHELAGVISVWDRQGMVHRDTAGDVGTAHSAVAEMRREDLGAVVVAAGKRLGEALRVIEEFCKTFDAGAAGKIERIRYRFYTLEQRIVGTLGRGKRFERVRLYVLITESACQRPWLEVARGAIAGGADCLQLREKELEGGELLRRAKILAEMCRAAGILFIVNDRADVAKLSGADGVHVGQGDLLASEVRRVVGAEMIVGVSTHNMEQARAAVVDGADYLGVGPVFRSATKTREILPGLEFATEVASIGIPAVAIAGISGENVDQVLATGIKRIAVTAAVSGCDDVEAATRALKAKL